MHDLPSGTTGYSFQWQFVGWETTLSTGGLSYNVPVLSYLVANVKQPPSKPQNMEATEVTTNSVTLEWESGFTTAAQYQVYRYMPNNTTGTKYALLGTVSGLEAKNGKYTLTDTEVQPSTQYQYVLKSVGTDGTSTDYTEPLAVTTLAIGDKPNITKQPESTSVRPGTDAVFTISATPTGGAGSVTYRWQSRTDGGRWTDLNRDTPTLTIEKPAKSMSGTEYRCIVSQTDLSTEKSSVVYSDTVKLTVGKADSITVLETSGTGGNATHETTAGETTKTVTAQYNISGKTYQKYDNAYTGDKHIESGVYGTSDSTGYQYYAMTPDSLQGPDANGVYTGTFSGTPTALTAASDRVTQNGTAYEIGDNGFRRTPQTETIGETAYTVYTASGVAESAGTQETLTLYCKDGKYYRKDSNGNPVEMTGKTTIDGEVTNTYRTDSLTPVYVTENGYTVLTYTPTAEGATELKIYELNGTYYSESNGTYTSLPLVTGLYQNTDGKLFKPGAAVTTEVKTTGSKTQVLGNEVTLTAAVKHETDATAADNGPVTFEITNTTTGSVVRYPVSKSSGNSPVECKWTPSEAGVYSIVAIFGGNSETNGSRSGAVTYYAKAADDLYEISVSDCTYGDTISPSLKSVTINNGSGSASGVDKTVTYAAYKDGSSAVTNWESGKTLVPGTYRITATESGNEIASKYITVSKKPITITAPNKKGDAITFNSFVTGDDYKTLFKTEGMPTDKTAGVYNVSVVYDESISNFADKQAEFFSKYTPTLKNSMVVVQTDAYKVTYSNGNNGTLQGYQGGYSTSFKGGADIASGSNVIFVATPAKNYQVWKWTVKSDGQDLTKGSDYTLSDDNKTLTVSSLQKNLDVHVEFSNQFYTVSAQSDTYGSVTATANGNPLAATSVLSGTEVTFTAAPKKDYVVKQWTVKHGTDAAKVQTNADGTVFSGSELKLTITANTVVNVTFEQTAQFEVHYSAVDQEDTNKEIALNFETTGLTDGKGEKGSAVTLTAKPSSAMGIAGWQYKTAESGTWINSSVTGLRYTIRNLQSNIWVRALVNDNATPTEVNFGIVDESGKAVAGGGKLTAKYTANGTEITDGAECMTYSKITFTYTEPTTYEVVKWQVNKADVTAVRNGKTFTYTIDSLTTPTTVNMVVRAKPIVTVTPPKNGTISVAYTLNGKTVEPEEGKYVYSGTKAIVTAAPNDNYVATDVKADSGSSIITTPNTDKVNGVQTLTVAEIKANTTFSATFVEKPVVTIKPGENGSVEVKGTINDTANTTLETGNHVDFGTDLTITATPANGYVVDKIHNETVNANKANGAKDKTLEKVGENTEITATFLAKPKVTISTAAGGTVEVKGTVDGTEKTLTTGNYVDFGTSLTVTLTPDTGYEVGSMNGVSPAYTDGTGTTTDNKSYTISGVDKNQTIKPVWSAIPTTTVNWSVIDKTPDTNGGTNGTLKATVTRKSMSAYAVTDSKGGTLTVYRDSVVKFDAIPDTGYKTGVWQLNGKKQDSQPELTITNDIVNTTQKVEVQFDPLGNQVTYGFKEGSAAADKHNATLSAAFTPNIGPATDFTSGNTPNGDGSITFTVSDLDDGYEVEGWYVDGSKQTGETGTTFTHKVTHNIGMDVQVKIVRKSYTVNFSAKNGTVTAQANNAPLATGNSVVGDTSVTFTAMLQSATGYTFDGWTVNGKKREGTDETLTLNITENTTVSAAYTLNTVSYAVNYGVTSENGTLTAKNGTKTFDSGAKQPAGSTIVFTAQPKDGYQVKGWYTAAEGDSAIPDTTSEQNRYTITNLTDAATVYVAFEPIPTYDITLSTTGLGHVTATVNGKNTDITDGKLTVSRHAKVVLTAVPDANQYLTGWTLDDETKGNSSLSLTLDDVTDGHTVKADFAASQLVTLKTICNANGTLPLRQATAIRSRPSTPPPNPVFRWRRARRSF